MDRKAGKRGGGGGDQTVLEGSSTWQHCVKYQAKNLDSGRIFWMGYYLTLPPSGLNGLNIWIFQLRLSCTPVERSCRSLSTCYFLQNAPLSLRCTPFQKSYQYNTLSFLPPSSKQKYIYIYTSFRSTFCFQRGCFLLRGWDVFCGGKEGWV